VTCKLFRFLKKHHVVLLKPSDFNVPTTISSDYSSIHY